MTAEGSEEFSASSTDTVPQSSGSRTGGENVAHRKPSEDGAHQPATVLVRGESVRGDVPQSQSKKLQPEGNKMSPPEAVSDAKVKLQKHLPALDDDSIIAQQKDQVVTRDGKADLAFTGTLLASAAPASAPTGSWDEYRIYETSGGKHVFSKIHRSVSAAEDDTSEAEIFDPTPSSMPSQLLRSARDLTRSAPVTWKDAAVDFFGYEPLAKVLYRKLGNQFEEHIV